MRKATSLYVAALLAGSCLLGATAAFAGADDGQSKAFFMPGPGAMTDGAASAPDGYVSSNPVRTRNEGYRATYNEAAQPSGGSVKPAAPPPEYYHAMGTMGVP